jgi:hypothetical protein
VRGEVAGEDVEMCEYVFFSSPASIDLDSSFLQHQPEKYFKEYIFSTCRGQRKYLLSHSLFSPQPQQQHLTESLTL